MKRNLKKYTDREEFISEHLRYDADTGDLLWIKRPRNSRVIIGGKAGSMQASGRATVHIQRKTLYVHHIAWWRSFGVWPKEEIDHINNCGWDNRLCNLREASRKENTRNVRPWSKTGVGLKGAYTHSSMNGRWFGQIVVDGQQIYLGRFDTEIEAHEAYCRVAPKYHGKFSRTS